mgnify:CR=1 FL=1
MPITPNEKESFDPHDAKKDDSINPCRWKNAVDPWRQISLKQSHRMKKARRSTSKKKALRTCSVHPTAGKSPPIDDKKDVSMCSSRKEIVDPWIIICFHDRLLAKKGSVEKSGRANEGWNKFNLTRGNRAKQWTTPFQRSLVLRESLGRCC